MSNAYGSPTDQAGSNNIVRYARKMEDFAVETTRAGIPDHWKKIRGSYNITRRNPFLVSKPILITANDTIRFWGEFIGDGQFFYTGTDPLFFTLPLHEGTITSFSNNSGMQVTTDSTNSLKVGDIIKVIDSRVPTYNGNHTITSVQSPTVFTTDNAFTVTDDRAIFKQTDVFIESIADGGTGFIDLTMTAHPFVVDDWINVTNTTTDNDGDAQITDVPNVNTITIAGTFSATSTGLVNTAANTVNWNFERFNNFFGAEFMDIQGRSDFTTVVLNSTLLTQRDITTGSVSSDSFWTLGEARDCLSVGGGLQSAFFNALGFRSFGNKSLFMRTVFTFNSATSFATDTLQPIFRICDGDITNFVFTNSQTGISENSSLVDIPQNVDTLFSADLANNTPDPSPGIYFSLGYNARAEGVPTDGSGPSIIIPVSSTYRFRVNDAVSLSESSSYNTTGVIDDIVDDTSIEVNTSFVAAVTTDTNITVVDNLDGTITITVDDTTGFTVNDYITITGSDPDYDDTYRLLEIPTGTTIIVTGTDLGDFTTDGTVAANTALLITDTTLASLDQTDPKVISINNTGVKNSMATGQSNLDPITTDPFSVVVSGQDTFTAIDGIEWLNPVLERFTGTTDGILTYTGLATNEFVVSWSCTLTDSAGGSNTLEATVFINGLEDSTILSALYEDQSGNIQITGTATIPLSTGDTLQVYVKNVTGTTDIDIYRSTLTVQF